MHQASPIFDLRYVYDRFSTLTEQLIAGHPCVAAVGELDLLPA